MNDIFAIFFFDPFLNVLIFLYQIMGDSMGLAIIALTILFRMVVFPLNWKMLRSQRKMQQLKPHLDEIKKTHKDDKMAQSQAQMDLYKEHGVSPVGGCLPLLLQIPFLFGIYAVLNFVVHLANINELNDKLYFAWLHVESLSALHLQFLWFDLAKPDPLYILPILAGVTQFLLSWMMLPPKEAKKPAKSVQPNLEESMAMAQRQMVYFFPIVTFIINLSFPAGLSMYWTVGNLFSILQQFYVNKKMPHPVITAGGISIVTDGEIVEKVIPSKKKQPAKKSRKGKKK